MLPGRFVDRLNRSIPSQNYFILIFFNLLFKNLFEEATIEFIKFKYSNQYSKYR